MAASNIEHTQQGGDPALPGFRIESVTALRKAHPWATDAKAQLAEVERKGKRASGSATKDGWNQDELKKLGLGDDAAAVATHRSQRSVSTGER